MPFALAWKWRNISFANTYENVEKLDREKTTNFWIKNIFPRKPENKFVDFYKKFRTAPPKTWKAISKTLTNFFKLSKRNSNSLKKITLARICLKIAFDNFASVCKFVYWAQKNLWICRKMQILLHIRFLAHFRDLY